jgi:glycosyltransferase involved in cell wall biosynthesis
MRLVIVASHPVQYQAPLFRELAQSCDTQVFFAHHATGTDQAAAGFAVNFEWDIDLLSGFAHEFLENVARAPNLESFTGCDTPTIDDQIEKLEPDAIVVMGWHLKCYWQAILSARRRRIPVMVRGDSHLETPRSRLKRTAKEIIYPVALRAFDAALYVGQRSRQYWEHYRFPADRMFFSPHCVDNETFSMRSTTEAGAKLRHEHGISLDSAVVLMASRLVPFKRPFDLLAAAERLTRAGQPVTVMIAGSGELENAVKSAAADAGISLVMLGFCNQSLMPAVYAAADLLVLASDHHETWGLVANEALACGRPIVVSDACGCAPDLAADGRAGRVFAIGNVEELTAAVSDVLLSPPALDVIAEKARAYGIAAAATGILDACSSLRRGSWHGVALK